METPSPWSAESDAEFESPTQVTGFVSSADRPASSEVLDDGAGRRSPWRGARWVVAALAVFAAMALVWWWAGSERREPDADAHADLESAVGATEHVDPLVTEPFAGADRRRLPSRLDQLWRSSLVDVSAVGSPTVTVLDEGSVIAVFNQGADGRSDDRSVVSESAAVTMLDGEAGVPRWTTIIDSRARALDVLGAFGEIVVLERLDTENRALLGLSLSTGEVRWERATMDPGVHVVPHGAGVVARVSFTVSARITFIDPATGDEVGRVPGRFFATDYLGTWYVRNASAVTRIDLRDGWDDPVPLDTLWVDDDAPATVVDGRLVALDDGRLETRGPGGAPAPMATVGAAGTGGFAGLDSGANFVALAPLVDGAFVVVGARSVFGATIDADGDAEVRWRSSGTPIETHPTDRGLSLVVASEGGASMRVVDGSTGREITVVEVATGAAGSLELVGDGVIVQRTAVVGVERVGLDLDGNRLWSLVGDGPLAVGPGVVVTYGASDDGVAITAYGDGET